MNHVDVIKSSSIESPVNEELKQEVCENSKNEEECNKGNQNGLYFCYAMFYVFCFVGLQKF